ncbi:MAG TPA: hypothetical protein PKA24_04340, partial [Microthrixaceae bacterium]|nr:hypothetical protein [Microthrixaceae bacterium]
MDREHEGDGSDAVADIAPARFVPMPASGSAQARSTVRGVLALQLAANGVGLAVVLAYVGLLMGRPDGEDGRLNLVVFGAYLAVQIALLVPINLVLLSRAVAWVREGVQPTAVQRRLVLRLPLLETIPALVAYRYLRGRVDALVIEMEKEAMKLVQSLDKEAMKLAQAPERDTARPLQSLDRAQA